MADGVLPCAVRSSPNFDDDTNTPSPLNPTDPNSVTRTQWIANMISHLQSGYEPLGILVLITVYSCVIAVCFLPPETPTSRDDDGKQ